MLIVLAGPTGTGKTALALDLAEALAAEGGAAEIVNADSMQLYRGMDVGTAKPSVAERRGVPHHAFDLWDVVEPASVAAYRDVARSAIDGIAARGATPVLVGGSGLYVEAVLRELEFPATDADLRARLEAEGEALGSDSLWRRLAEQDPVAAGRIHSANLRKVVRALEVVTLTGRPFAASLPESAPLWRDAARFTLDVPNEVLAPALTERARRMWHEGDLLGEVRGLLPQGLADGPTASRAIGYAQAIAVLAGSMDEEEGLAETTRLTWRMVRRQRAWFGRDRGSVALDGLDRAGALGAVRAAVRAAGPVGGLL